jgi:hypothetical protein
MSVTTTKPQSPQKATPVVQETVNTSQGAQQKLSQKAGTFFNLAKRHEEGQSKRVVNKASIWQAAKIGTVAGLVVGTIVGGAIGGLVSSSFGGLDMGAFMFWGGFKGEAVGAAAGAAVGTAVACSNRKKALELNLTRALAHKDQMKTSENIVFSENTNHLIDSLISAHNKRGGTLASLFTGHFSAAWRKLRDADYKAAVRRLETSASAMQEVEQYIHALNAPKQD